MARDLEGKVILLTGGTEGIGKAAALELARRGADLTIVGRNPEKTERVLGELKAAGGEGGTVRMLLGDLSSMAEVRRVASEFKASRQRLDVLVNNAGAIFAHKHLTADGLEMTFALNHLGYFLLTRELFYTAVTRAKSRLRVVGGPEAVRTAIESPALRASGLASRVATRRGQWEDQGRTSP